jgi:hypothetical protein
MRHACLAAVSCCFAAALPPFAEAQTCAWRPWAANWSEVNGLPQFPPNNVYNPTNWDYTFSQTTTILAMPLDVPTGGGTRALHMFFASQPTYYTTKPYGSGGVYQELAVQPGRPLQYSYYWKGAGGPQYNWFEFILIDGPFSPQAADISAEPNIIRKRELANSSWTWANLTDQSPADLNGSGQPRPRTITPTGPVATVVLKFGHNPTGNTGAVEVFFDRVEIRQDNGPNLVINGDFEDTAQAPVCDSEYMFKDPARSSYWFGVTQCPGNQHTTSAVSPLAHDNASNTTLTITGTFLETVSGARLIPAAGGAELAATTITKGSGTNLTSITAVFPTAGAADGVYSLVTEEAPSPFCLTQTLDRAFTLLCPTSTTITAVTPPSILDAAGAVVLTISGANLDRLTGLKLQNGTSESPTTVTATSLVMNGTDLRATFNLACVPAGPYRLVGSRADACRGPVRESALQVLKSSPAHACAWLPWAAAWSSLNTGVAISPGIYNPINWDYSLSQATVLDTPKTVPAGGGNFALHWFLDAQPDETTSNGLGSGGVYQQLTVTPGVPLEYAYWWRAACTEGTSNWFEFLLIDGPFNIAAADGFSESTSANNPAVIRKRVLVSGGFDWSEVTQATPADVGPAGPRLQTLTPTGSIATVVLKAGRVPAGAMESFWDNVAVRQAGGPNLVVDGDFEDYLQRTSCDASSMAQDACEQSFWRWNPYQPLPPCPQPFGDTDGDRDMDLVDFAAVQRCLSGSGSPLAPECRCFDRPQPLAPNGVIDEFDLLTFIHCSSGPAMDANVECGN